MVDLWGGLKLPAASPGTRARSAWSIRAPRAHRRSAPTWPPTAGLLDLDAPVTRYWPEFAQAGKEAALVSMMLDHSVGVPAVREPLPKGAVYDYDYMCERLAAEAPFWPPGTRNGYHGLTSAWTVGEMVRRSTGRRLGRFFAEEVAGPLGLDFWIGLPEELEPRVAPMVAYPPDDRARNSRIALAMREDPMGPTGRFMLNGGGFQPNTPRGSCRRDRLRQRRHQRARPGRALRAAGQWRER